MIDDEDLVPETVVGYTAYCPSQGTVMPGVIPPQAIAGFRERMGRNMRKARRIAARLQKISPHELPARRFFLVRLVIEQEIHPE